MINEDLLIILKKLGYQYQLMNIHIRNDFSYYFYAVSDNSGEIPADWSVVLPEHFHMHFSQGSSD